MSSGINLIATKNQGIFTPLLSRIKMLRYIAIGMLFVVSVFSMILFILIAFSPLPALQKQELGFKATLSQFHTDMARLLILNERLTSISGIISKRTDYNIVIDALRSKVPPGSTITSLQIGKKTVSVGVTSSSLSDIDSVISGILSDTGVNKTFSSASLTTLVLDRTRGVYLLDLALTIP